MTKSTDTAPRPGPSPQAATAATDLLVAAWQRSFALQADWIDQIVHRSLEQSRQALRPESLTDPRALMAATMRGAWPAASLAEPTWRWLGALMAVGRETTASMMALTTAQMRGAAAEVDSIARDAHDEVDRATTHAAAAAAAAGNAMSRGMASVARLGEFAAYSGDDALRSAGEAAGYSVAQAAQVVTQATGAVGTAAGQAGAANGSAMQATAGAAGTRGGESGDADHADSRPAREREARSTRPTRETAQAAGERPARRGSRPTRSSRTAKAAGTRRSPRPRR